MSTKDKNICIIENCKKKQHSKSGYCLLHLPKHLRCQAITSNHTRCKLPIVPETPYCKIHAYSGDRTLYKYKQTKKEHKRAVSNWIYLFDTKQMSKQGRYGVKIGISNNPKKREESLTSGNPLGKMIFAADMNKNAKNMESRLHKRFALTNIQRECFWLTSKELDDIIIYLRTIAVNTMFDKEYTKARKHGMYSQGDKLRSTEGKYSYIFDAKQKNAIGRNLVRIGISTDPDKMLKKLQEYNPIGEFLVINFLSKEVNTIKNWVKKKYSSYKEKGNWYWLTEDQVQDAIEYLKF